MPVRNEDIAAVFDEIADILEIQQANPFRVRAYRNASQVVGRLDTPLADMVARHEDLTALPSIGTDLAAKIAEIVATGSCAALQKLRGNIPEGLTDLLRVPGLGPKRVQALYHELDIHDLEQLHRAAKDGRLRALAGFGRKLEAQIEQATEAVRQRPQRVRLATAAAVATPLVAYLEAVPGVRQVVVAGSFRRARETVGDLDILVTATADSPVMRRFVAYEDVADVVSHGKTRSTVILRSGLQVDLRVVAQASYGSALHYFTGSKAHNIEVRRMAQQRGLKLNEYGVFRGAKRIAGATEESVFAAVDLPYIPPELRENRGEIDAARDGRLPKLVALDDLRGDLHMHTKATDGRNSVREMAQAGRELGFEYIAITDHSKRLTMVHGLSARRLHTQIDTIDKLNDEAIGIRVLKGIEVDILQDGALDLPDSVLSRLDLVIGAVHSRFGETRERQTERIMRAMDNPNFTMLAHPSGRLIPDREPYDVDMGRLIRHARERGCFLELNAHPERLDLFDIYCQAAKAEGVLVSINSDAHDVHGLEVLRYGIGQARRGWLEKGDVLNTRPLAALLRLLRGTRA